LIVAGHPAADVWGYTPRQLNGWLTLAGKRQKAERIEQLALMALATQGDLKAVKKQLKDWEQ